MTREEKIICKEFLDDADKTHSCNEYKLLMALLEQEPTTKNDLVVDAISRADARSLICNIDIKHQTFGMSRKAFKDLYNGMDELPSVTPISKDCTDCIAEDKTFMKMDRIKQLLNSDKLDDLEVLEKIREVVEE